MKLTYAPCGRGGRKSGFIWKMIFLLFSSSLVDKSQQVSKSYTWTRTCLSQTGAGSRYNFFRIEYQGPRNILYSSRAKRNEGLKMSVRCYYAIDCVSARLRRKAQRHWHQLTGGHICVDLLGDSRRQQHYLFR